eukprot:2556585-Rhodomonas_salina.1
MTLVAPYAMSGHRMAGEHVEIIICNVSIGDRIADAQAGSTVRDVSTGHRMCRWHRTPCQHRMFHKRRKRKRNMCTARYLTSACCVEADRIADRVAQRSQGFASNRRGPRSIRLSRAGRESAARLTQLRRLCALVGTWL